MDLPKVTISDAPPVDERPTAEASTGEEARDDSKTRTSKRPRRRGGATRDRGVSTRDRSAPDDDDRESDDAGDADLAEVFVNVGRKDGVTAADLRATLTERAGLSDDDIRYVRVKFKHSFVGIPKQCSEASLEALNGATLGEREVLAEPARRPSVLPSAAPSSTESAEPAANDAPSEATSTT